MKQFLNVSETMTEFGISEASARSLVRGVRDNARYGNDLGNAPAYKPLELERELGIGDAQFVNVHDLAVELFRVMVGNIGRITV